MAAFVDDLSYVSLEIAFDLLLGRTVGESALVITTRILTSLHLFLSVFPPVVAVVGFSLLSNVLRLLGIWDLRWLLWGLIAMVREILRETMWFGFCCRKFSLFVDE